MFKNSPAAWLVPLFFFSGVAAAQTQSPASPGSEMSPSSTLSYRSAFEGYRPYTEDKILGWKEVNDATSSIGGWRAYAKEARQPDGKAPAHDMANMPSQKDGGSKP